ncbi:uncharacterized protein MKK02DRAFT_38522 [Dioszegia hungarica]|uniref:C2H2-type domain-containing protein n=1 Tax=Dioszegia hungarica TaxID=4972 RepID=A0AA38LUG7_9TREE|nr:uncharacterized protein MKK02DRAFT_38522 [Dioszegia hungarica]KAI9633856.1 hypothetical protein MKK02DRAFT_38522 [Dioszegia hungarica]
MLTLQRSATAGPSAIAGPSRLPTQPPILAPTPKRARSKIRSPSFSPFESSSCSVPPATPVRPRATTTPSRPPSRTERRYQCIHAGCDKAYFKPSRLKEHELTHTGERPHACPHCDQTYLRASHLTAHMRTHLPSSARSFECSYDGCDKAFWTATHLKRHQEMHEKVEVYPCPHCSASFHKANQLRDHHAMAHMPAGTRSFICPHEDCSASFAMRQQLKAHEKTHDASRYTCSHPSHQSHPTFPTWSALQTHLHTDHPPQCPHPECGGKIFKSAQRLKDHLKVHALRAEDAVLRMESGEEDDRADAAVLAAGRKRRRSSAAGLDGDKGKKRVRLAKVDEAIEKEFGCEEEDCDRILASKSSLKKHRQSVHAQASRSVPQQFSTSATKPASGNVDILTGPVSAKSLGDTRRYGCPINRLPDAASDIGVPTRLHCYSRFWRVYDVRRHLKAEHGLELDDEEVRELLVEKP